MQLRSSVHANKTEASMEKTFSNQQNQQLEEVVQYCMVNVRGYKALIFSKRYRNNQWQIG